MMTSYILTALISVKPKLRFCYGWKGELERKVDGTAHRLFQRDLEERPTATLAQRRELMTRMAGVSVSDSTVSLTFRRMGFSRKKRLRVLRPWCSRRLASPV
jgi:hypothetical protein